MPQQILVPVDYSEESLHAARFAATLAESLGGGLTLVNFWECPPVARSALASGSVGVGPRTLGELLVEQAESEMAQFIERAAFPLSVPITSTLHEGNPAKETVALSQSGNFSMVVMGTHGRTGLSQVMLGSVAERVVRLSPIPVITVPRPSGS